MIPAFINNIVLIAFGFWFLSDGSDTKGVVCFASAFVIISVFNLTVWLRKELKGE